MIIVMKRGASQASVDAVVSKLETFGSEAHVSQGQLRTVIGALGDRSVIRQVPWEAFEGVERAVPVLDSFKFVSREFQPEDSVIEVRGVPIGRDDRFVVPYGGAPSNRVLPRTRSRDSVRRRSNCSTRPARSSTCRSSLRCWILETSNWCLPTPTSSVSGRGTCPTTPSCRKWDDSRSRSS